MLNYVKSFCGFHGRGLLCLALCALVVPVGRAAIYQAGNSPGDSIIWIPLDDCCANNKPITLQYNLQVYRAAGPGAFGAQIYSSGNQQVVTGSAGCCSCNGSYQLLDVGAVPPGLCAYSLSVSIGPAEGDNAVYQQFTETWYGAGAGNAGYYGNGVHSYGSIPGASAGCNSGNGYGPSTETSNTSQGFTNGTAGPELITTTDGQQFILQPGQGTNVTVSWADGGSGGINAQNLNANSGSFDLNDGTTYISNNPGWNGSQWTNDLVQSGGFTNPINYGASSSFLSGSNGGPIIWSGTNLTAAQVDEAGFNDLGNIIGLNNAQINSNLLALYNLMHGGIPVNIASASNLIVSNAVTVYGGTNYSSGGTNIFISSSNVWVENWPTNFGSSGTSTNVSSVSSLASNVWVQNWPFTNMGIGLFSNLLNSQVAAGTNAGVGMVAPFSSASGPIQSGIPSVIEDQGGGDGLGNIMVGDSAKGTVTFALVTLPPGMMTFYSSLRGLVAWAIIAGSLLWNCRFAFNCLSECLRTSGSRGVSTGPITDQFGGMGAVAIIASSLVLSLVVTLPVLAVGLMSGELGFLSGTTSPSSFMSGAGVSLQWVDQVFPVWVLVSSCGFEILYFFVIRSACLVLMTAIKFIPGA